MTTLFTVLGLGLLFGLFGLVLHNASGGNCGSCGSETCDSKLDDPQV
jgi:uncharacterized ferredoxin-like protein